MTSAMKQSLKSKQCVTHNGNEYEKTNASKGKRNIEVDDAGDAPLRHSPSSKWTSLALAKSVESLDESLSLVLVLDDLGKTSNHHRCITKNTFQGLPRWLFIII